MTKPYQKLMGNRIYLLLPQIPESKIVLTEEAKKEFAKSERQKLMRLTIYDVGSTVVDYKEGDEVMVDATAIQSLPIVELTKDLTVLVASVFNISHIW